jgi:hypothetical protein
MNESLFHRRKFLEYLGLGAAGIGTALVLGNRSHPKAAIVTDSLAQSSSNALAVQATDSKTLPELRGISNWSEQRAAGRAATQNFLSSGDRQRLQNLESLQ